MTKKVKVSRLAGLIMFIGMGSGMLNAVKAYEKVGSGAVVEAVYTASMPPIDGHIDETIWAKAKGYRLGFSRDKEGVPAEAAEVKFAWNEHGLYLAARLDDSELIANNDQDEQFHQRCGDTLELFVKPKNDSYYWEMYATPKGNKTTLFWFRSISRKTFTDPLTGHAFRGLRVGACADGTVNNPASPDRGWTAEMWVPANQLTHFGETWGSGTNWTVLVGRYNYSSGSQYPENSMFPPLSQTWFHLTDEYADLKFLPAP
jgi:hypothetical protein